MLTLLLADTNRYGGSTTLVDISEGAMLLPSQNYRKTFPNKVRLGYDNNSWNWFRQKNKPVTWG